jgi:hypothetical protein
VAGAGTATASMVDEARLPEHSLLSMRLDTRRSSTAAVWLRCSIRLDAVVSAKAPRTLAPDGGCRGNLPAGANAAERLDFR